MIHKRDLNNNLYLSFNSNALIKTIVNFWKKLFKILNSLKQKP